MFLGSILFVRFVAGSSRVLSIRLDRVHRFSSPEVLCLLRVQSRGPSLVGEVVTVFFAFFEYLEVLVVFHWYYLFQLSFVLEFATFDR